MRNHLHINLTAVLLLLMLSIFVSCIEDGEDEQCEQAPGTCNTTAPNTGKLYIDLTINSENPNVDVKIKTGLDYDSGTPYEAFNTASTSVTRTVQNNDYSAMVEYTLTYKGTTYKIEAVAGDTLSPDGDSYCNDVYCYTDGEITLDLTFDEQGFKDMIDNENKTCFIATAAYGTPDAPNVLVLRNFRDTVLRESAAGRYLIDVYYRFSPYFAAKIAGSEILRAIARVFISILVLCILHPVSILLSLSVIAAAGISWYRITARPRNG